MLMNIPLAAYSQCADIYSQGEAFMKKRKYHTAIKYFRQAKSCDKSLAKKCDENIRKCQEYLKPQPVVSKIITLNAESLHFGAESTAAQSIKVECAVDWECESNADWCTIVKKNEKSVSITCAINESVGERKTVIRLYNDGDTKNVEIIQEGQESFIEFAADQIDLGKEGDILRIPLACNTTYKITSKPDWVNVIAEEPDMIIIEVGAYAFPKKENIRQGVLSIGTSDGKSDFVIVAQHKKYKKPKVNASKDKQKAKKSNNNKIKAYIEKVF